MGTTDSLAALARPVLAAAGLELWDVEVSSRLVRFLVDRPSGVDLDAVATAGDVLAPILEDHDELLPAGSYDLEVSSPGIERTLRTPEHFQRSTGALLAVKTKHPVDASGARRLRATLAASDGEAVELVPEGATEPLRLPVAEIERAHIVFEWGPAPRPAPKRTKRERAKKGGARSSTEASQARPARPAPHPGPATGGTAPAADEKGSGS